MRHRLRRALGEDRHLRDVLRRAPVAAGLKLSAALLGFVSNLATARYLGASGSGSFYVALTAANLTALVARLGLDNSLVRLTAGFRSTESWASLRSLEQQSRRLVLGAALVLALLLGTVGAQLAVRFFGQADTLSIWTLMALVVVPQALSLQRAFMLQGAERPAQSILVQTILPQLFYVVLLTLLVPPLGLLGAVVAMIAAYLVDLSLAELFWRQVRNPSPTGDPGFSLVDSVLKRNGAPFLAYSLLQQLTIALPTFFLARYLNSESVGIFESARRSALLINLILVAVNIVLGPKFAALHRQNDVVGLRRLLRQTTMLMLAIAVPAFVLVVLLKGPLMGLFGPAFRQGADALLIMAVGQLINVATGPIGLLLLMSGRERGMLGAMTVTGFLSLGLNFWLVPRYGVNGAATAFAIVIAMQNLFVAFLLRSVFQAMSRSTKEPQENDRH